MSVQVANCVNISNEMPIRVVVFISKLSFIIVPRRPLRVYVVIRCLFMIFSLDLSLCVANGVVWEHSERTSIWR